MIFNFCGFGAELTSSSSHGSTPHAVGDQRRTVVRIEYAKDVHTLEVLENIHDISTILRLRQFFQGLALFWIFLSHPNKKYLKREVCCYRFLNTKQKGKTKSNSRRIIVQKSLLVMNTQALNILRLYNTQKFRVFYFV